MSEEVKKVEEVKEETKYARINIEGGKRKFAFLMEEGAGFGESYDAAYSVLSHLLNAINQAATNLKPKKPEENTGVETKKEKEKKDEQK
jgi:hypothetical protein